MIPVQEEQGTALSQGQSCRNPFSAAIPPFCHIPVALPHPWTKKCDLKCLTVTLSFREDKSLCDFLRWYHSTCWISLSFTKGVAKCHSRSLSPAQRSTEAFGECGSTRGGEGRPSCFLQLPPRDLRITFSFKASLMRNYKLICSLNTQVRDRGASRGVATASCAGNWKGSSPPSTAPLSGPCRTTSHCCSSPELQTKSPL